MLPEREFDLVVAGEINPDLILSGNVLPVFGQVEKLIDSMVLTTGSSSVIFACGAARLGMRVAFIGKVGQDMYGDFMRREMAARGIDLRGVVVDPQVSTGLSLILSTGSDRAILTYPGAIPDLAYADIDLDLLARARHLHLASFFIQSKLRPDVPRLFAKAHSLGLTTSLDTNYDPSEEWNGELPAVLAETDIFFPNETEICRIAGMPELEAALDWAAGRTGTTAVKLGRQGAVARKGDKTVRAAALEETVADTVGAGDSFDAGFVCAFLRGWDLADCTRLGAVCGSLSTRKHGGTAGQPDWEEALRYLDG